MICPFWKEIDRMVILPTGTVAGGHTVLECDASWRDDIPWDHQACGGDRGKCHMPDSREFMVCEIRRLRTKIEELVERIEELEEGAYQNGIDRHRQKEKRDEG